MIDSSDKMHTNNPRKVDPHTCMYIYDKYRKTVKMQTI